MNGADSPLKKRSKKAGARAKFGATTDMVNRRLIECAKAIERTIGGDNPRARTRIVWGDRHVAVDGFKACEVAAIGVKWCLSQYTPKGLNEDGTLKKEEASGSRK